MYLYILAYFQLAFETLVLQISWDICPIVGCIWNLPKNKYSLIFR